MFLNTKNNFGQLIDANNYFDFDCVQSIDFSMVDKGILTIDYLDYDKNDFDFQIDKISNNNIKIDRYYHYHAKFEFAKINGNEKLVINCDDCKYIFGENLYILYSNEASSSTICLINPKNFELSVTTHKYSHYLGEDKLGVYFRVVDSYYNMGRLKTESKFIRINSFNIETIETVNEFMPFNLPIKDTLLNGIIYANKDFAFLRADSADIVNAKTMGIDLFQNSLYFYGKIFDIKNVFASVGVARPILYDSILFFQSYKSENKFPRFNVSSVNQYGNIQIIFMEDSISVGTPIRDFKIYDKFMVIQSPVFFDKSNINKDYKDRLEVINLKTLEQYDIKEVKLNKVNIDKYLKK